MNKLVISYTSDDESYLDIDENKEAINKNNIDTLFGDIHTNTTNNTLSTQIIYYLNKYKSRLSTDIFSDPNKDVDTYLHNELKEYLTKEIETINTILMEFCNHIWVKDSYEHRGEMINCEICELCEIENN